MRALMGLLMAMTVLATSVAAQTPGPARERNGVDKAVSPEAKGKRAQAQTKGKRTKTTIPPRKGKKG
jgi:hypothetical protein